MAGRCPSRRAESDTDETVPASADTFLLYLDPSGKVVANPSRVALVGVPDTAAASASIATGEDLRTIEADGVDVRLLTMPVIASEGGTPVGFVQGGFVLTLHDAQSQSLVVVIALVGFVGLLGAAAVTLLVTGRALVPIRQSFDSQRRFVADASHELRTPTALIRANAEVLAREDLVADGGRPLVVDIVAESDRLSHLIGDLLQLAATDASGLDLDRQPVDLATIAADTVRQAAALAGERGVSLQMASRPGAGSTVVSGDRDRLIQLLLILLENAFDHSPPGGTVTVGVTPEGRSILMTVADQGPGIAVADRDKVFQPFARLPGVARDRAGGTGLGLAIARRIAAAHDATIAVDDAPGGGARIVVTFPVAAPTAG